MAIERKATRTLQASGVWLALVTACLMAAPNALAAPISGDLFAAGDGLVTVDGDLEWLDLTETMGMSYDAVLSSAYVTDLGFRYASLGEVEGLLASAGFAEPLVGGWLEGDKGPAALILDLLGCTGGCDTGRNPYAQGLTESARAGWAGQSYKVTLNLDADITDPSAAPSRGDAARSLWKTTSAETDFIGSFLIRAGGAGGGGGSPVPEPTAALLFAAGVLVVRSGRLQRPD